MNVKGAVSKSLPTYRQSFFFKEKNSAEAVCEAAFAEYLFKETFLHH